MAASNNQKIFPRGRVKYWAAIVLGIGLSFIQPGDGLFPSHLTKQAFAYGAVEAPPQTCPPAGDPYIDFFLLHIIPCDDPVQVQAGFTKTSIGYGGYTGTNPDPQIEAMYCNDMSFCLGTHCPSWTIWDGSGPYSDSAPWPNRYYGFSGCFNCANSDVYQQCLWQVSMLEPTSEGGHASNPDDNPYKSACWVTSIPGQPDQGCVPCDSIKYSNTEGWGPQCMKFCVHNASDIQPYYLQPIDTAGDSHCTCDPADKIKNIKTLPAFPGQCRKVCTNSNPPSDMGPSDDPHACDDGCP